jgi:hypothetical protein
LFDSPLETLRQSIRIQDIDQLIAQVGSAQISIIRMIPSVYPFERTLRSTLKDAFHSSKTRSRDRTYF